MSESTLPSATAAQQAMPLFFHRVVGVNPNMHAHLRLDRSLGYGFSRVAQSVPIGLGEFDMAAQHFPVVFTSGPTPAPVVLLGLGEGHNLFLEADGSWRKDAYVPAYVRAFPFIFVEDAASKNVYVGMEADAACLREDEGAPMFEDGKPTAALTEAINFCSAFRDNLTAANSFARALEAQGLLEEEEATVNFSAGGGTKIRGFKIVRADRLDRISDEMFIDWRHRGWIGPLYAHLHSTARWGRLIELAAAARTAAAG